MRNLLRSLKKSIEEHSPQNYSLVLVIPIVLYVLGFFIWNIYLYNFGFVDDDILRAKFILAGFTFTIFTFFAAICVYVLILFLRVAYALVLKLLSLCVKKDDREKLIQSLKESLNFGRVPTVLVCAFLFSIWIFAYTITVFPVIPGIFGGGQPRSLALLVDKDNLPMLETLGIQLGLGAIYQTQNLCVLDENTDSIFILLPDRAIRIDKSLYEGINSLPGVQTVQEEGCITLAQQFSSQGEQLDQLLLLNSFNNIYLGFTGQPLRYFFLTPLTAASTTPK